MSRVHNEERRLGEIDTHRKVLLKVKESEGNNE